MSSLKQLWGKIHYAPVTMAGMHVVVIQVKVFGGAITSMQLQTHGSPALSSFAHLQHKICDYAVYFHINKAQLFKLRSEFNLEAGLSAVFPHYLCVCGGVKHPVQQLPTYFCYK